MLNLRACLLMFVLVTGCDKKQRDKPADPPKAGETKPAETTPVETKPVEAAPDPTAGWTERKGDGFSVLAPQDPKVQTKDATTTGKPLPTTMYTHYVPDGPGAMQVMFTEIDPKSAPSPTAMFDAMRDSMMGQFGAKITKENDVTLGTAKGKEFWLAGEHPRMGKMGVHVRIVIADTRLYLVQALYQADATAFAAQGDKFIESFKLVN